MERDDPMEKDDPITLRMYLEQKIICVHEELKARLDANDKALVLQATELSRRLDELNHAHQEARQKEADFLSRETFEEVNKSWNQWRDGVNENLARNSGKGAAYASIAAIGISLAGLLLAFLRLQ